MLKTFRNIFFSALILIPSLALAADQLDPDVKQLYDFVINWYNNLLLPLGSVLAGIMIVYGGILYSASGGEPSKVQKGKEFIIGAISGEVLLLCVLLIVRSIIS